MDCSIAHVGGQITLAQTEETVHDLHVYCAVHIHIVLYTTVKQEILSWLNK